jgi:hypothetical protein
MTIKLKLFEGTLLGGVQERVNEFLGNNSVNNIEFRTVVCKEYVTYAFMLLYEDEDGNN